MQQLLSVLLVIICCSIQSQSHPALRYPQPSNNQYDNYHRKIDSATIHKPSTNHRLQNLNTYDDSSPDLYGIINNKSSSVLKNGNYDDFAHRLTSDVVDETSTRLLSSVQRSFLKNRRSNSAGRSGIRERGLNIGVHLNLHTTKKSVEESNLERLEDVLAKVLGGRLEEEVFNKSGCPSCDEESPEFPVKRIVKPAYPCDEWDVKFRICILERNIGDTVTFYLSTGSTSGGHRPNVTWKKEFHIRDSKERKELVIDPENSSENIIIGRRGYELRISPITEIDLGYNLFSASLQGYTSFRSKVFFMIRIVPIDLGFVYVGETIELNLRSYVSLPEESVAFKWYMEKDGEHGTLPSNMRVSASGGSIKISELRQEQEGILACSVYTNLNFLATKKRFLMKDLVRNNDVLKSAPDHNLLFKEITDREKRDPKTVPKRIKREIDMDEIIEKALMESTTTEKSYVPSSTEKYASRPSDDYNLDMDVGHEEGAVKKLDNFHQNPEYSAAGYQDINQNEDFPNTKQIDISVENGPVEVEESQELAPNPGDFGEGLRNGFDPADDINQQSLEKSQPSYKYMNQFSSNLQTDSPYYQVTKPSYRISSKQLPPPNQKQHPQKMLPSKMAEKDRNQYIDIDIQRGRKGNYVPQVENSEIILNIDKFPQQRQIPAEETVAKLISSCYSDLECSGSAICVRNNLKVSGFCKCLSGFYGVGIFCREDIWMSSSNFEIEELHNSEDIPFPNDSPSQRNK